ncbi:hypothetical protein ABK046_47980, partial [Streptomyces caeruleatus]
MEEGGGVSARAYEIAATRIGRHMNLEYGIIGKLIITGNPSRNWMYRNFYKPQKEGKLPKNKKYIQSFSYENIKG